MIHMTRNPIAIWIALSLLFWLTGTIWQSFGSANDIAFIVRTVGWVSSLIAIGYYSTPSNSGYGKLAFAGVIVMVGGIVLKILHYDGGNELIIIGLLGIIATYGVMWFGKRTS